MRRVFLILLALVLPFQLAWAGAATYCQHEEPAPASWHFGHHEHHHKAEPKADKEKLSLVDSDCGICLLASAPLAKADAPRMQTVQRVELVAAPSAPDFDSLCARAPDRPQWHRLA
ncbi:cation efflux protein, CzcI family [Cupriavidus sp. Agwp_2]|uniref:cation efflux protein, CzcI family n=1 Tax=Cupriavidus sp. Agwp_2 TaxID=2897324 RepID=UPI00346087CF